MNVPTHYQINVSKNGQHYFTTSEHSMRIMEDQAIATCTHFKTVFPTSEGYKVTMYAQFAYGQSVDVPEPTQQEHYASYEIRACKFDPDDNSHTSIIWALDNTAEFYTVYGRSNVTNCATALVDCVTRRDAESALSIMQQHTHYI